ncbi:YoaK family protein [uncultured Subdoligranulum sp.]|uniref:YoaK family protein n=1 Tax=uncultured Subdoligranulum sp. TaxID=512298 RepID=UPI0025D9C443|nr:YoaK family protein [uncultured Subdoligranulum sp.]
MSIHPTRARLSPRQEEIRFALLAVGGGVAGAYGSVYCGHVFANALTGNLVSLAAELYAGQWAGVLARLGGVGLFLLGVALSVVLPVRMAGGDPGVWQRRCLLVEAGCFALQALLPYRALTALSPALYLWPVFFASGLQYNTFTALHGVPISTLFCTNNLRQLTLHGLVARRQARAGQRAEADRETRIALSYLAVTGLFCLGLLLGVALLAPLGPRLMWLNAALLLGLWLWQKLAAPAD